MLLNKEMNNSKQKGIFFKEVCPYKRQIQWRIYPGIGEDL